MKIAILPKIALLYVIDLKIELMYVWLYTNIDIVFIDVT